MRGNDYNNLNSFGKGSMNDPYPIEKKKSTFTKILLIGFLLFIVGSYGYEKLIKDKDFFKKEETARKVQSPFTETASEDYIQTETPTATSKSTSIVNHTKSAAADTHNAAQKHMERKEDNRSLSTSEILDRRIHENVVKQAKRAGVSSEGSTSEILDRITHANVVKQAKRAGVSTEGSTSEILDRITHANVVNQAKRAGVSTEGNTSEILDRITHANVVKQAKRAGVSTEGSTSDILDRITRKSLERYGY